MNSLRPGSPPSALPAPPQTGIVLVTALVLMLAVLAMGVAAARSAIHAGESARFERDRHIALAAAEAALSDAERDIESANGAGSARAALFAAGQSGFSKGCGKGGDDLGLCLAEADGATPVWQSADLTGPRAVEYGRFTGARMAAGPGLLPALAPRYIIEFIPVAGASAGSGSFYRITAIGFGARDGTRVVLQSFYRTVASTGPPAAGKHAAASSSGPQTADAADNNGPPPGAPPAATALPCGRIAWREIANWSELHQAAVN